MGIKDALAAGAAKGALSFLSELLGLVHSQFVAGGDADDETKKALATVVLFYPELQQGARRSDTQYDDQILAEVLQYAEAQLPASFLAEARGLYGPEDVTTTEPGGTTEPGTG